MKLEEYLKEINNIYEKLDKLEGQAENLLYDLRDIRQKMDDLPLEAEDIEVDKEED